MNGRVWRGTGRRFSALTGNPKLTQCPLDCPHPAGLPGAGWGEVGGGGGRWGDTMTCSIPSRSSQSPREVEPVPSPHPAPTNQSSSDPTCFFASPTLSPVTRGLKEGDRGGSLPRRQRGPSCPSRPPTEPAPGAGARRPPPPRAGRRSGKAAPAPAAAPLPSLAQGGAAAPRSSPWSPLAAEWGLRKGRGVPRGAEAASAPAPAPCGSGVSESGPRGAQDGGGGGGSGPSSAEGGR